MMKIKITIFIILVFQLTFSQINGTIVYSFSFEKLENKKNLDKDKLDMMFILMEKTIQTLENAEFVLKFNSENSYYRSNFMSLENDMSMAGKGTFFDHKEVYCDAKPLDLNYISNVIGKDYLVKYPYLNSTIFDEFKTIDEIKTQKAILIINEKQYAEVWFSTSNSLPYGPSIFFGLPGIVLEATVFVNEIYKYTYKASSVKISTENVEVKIKPSNLESKTYEEVQKIYKEARKNIGRN